MKIFDWKKNKREACNERHTWLKENHTKKISEKDFIIAMEKIKLFSKAKNVHKTYNMRNIKWQYNNLKTKFGFFV